MSEKKCSERIAENMLGREKSLSDIFDLSDEDSDGDTLYEYPLGIETFQVIKVHLSFGGPADWIEITLSDSEIKYVVYHFADWFDHAEINVGESSPLYRYAEFIVEILNS